MYKRVPNSPARRLIPCSAQPGRLISNGVQQPGCRKAACDQLVAQTVYKALHVACMCCAVFCTNHQAARGWELEIDEAMDCIHKASVHARC